MSTSRPPLEKLEPTAVERPWGGSGLPEYGLVAPAGRPTGEYWLPCEDFPLLVKVLDAKENLSIQLHPDDHVARARGLKNGKTEAWLVLAAQPEAQLWLGLEAGSDPAQFLAAASRGEDVSPRLVRFVPRAGEFYFVPAGTVHALGAGITVLEIQQTSDVTYRVYDWNRQPPRTLHLEEAKAAIQATTGARKTSPSPAAPDVELVTCPYFRIDLYRRSGPESVLQLSADVEMFFVSKGHGTVRGGELALDLTPGAFFMARPPLRSIQIMPARTADAAAPLELVRISPR